MDGRLTCSVDWFLPSTPLYTKVNHHLNLDLDLDLNQHNNATLPEAFLCVPDSVINALFVSPLSVGKLSRLLCPVTPFGSSIGHTPRRQLVMKNGGLLSGLPGNGHPSPAIGWLLPSATGARVPGL